MYNQIGKELKGWAKFIVVLLTIPYVLAGIAVVAVLGDMDLGFLGVIAAIVIIIIGYFFARFGGMLLYAFGELVDRVCSIEERSGNNKDFPKVKNAKRVETKKKVDCDINGTPVVERKRDGAWQCPFCEYVNPAGADWCEKCGIQANFE